MKGVYSLFFGAGPIEFTGSTIYPAIQVADSTPDTWGHRVTRFQTRFPSVYFQSPF